MSSSNAKQRDSVHAVKTPAEEIDFDRITRRLLFGQPTRPETIAGLEIPGAGRSAASEPRRHVRNKITLNVDGDIVEYFKTLGRERGRAYQLLINDALREYIEGNKPERLAQQVAGLLLSSEDFLAEISAAVEAVRGR